MPEPSTPTMDQSSLSQLLIEKLDKSLNELQLAQEQLLKYTTTLADHDSAPDAHMDIRAKLNDIIAGTGFATTDFVNNTVVNAIHDHNLSESSHPGLQGVINELKTTIQLIDTRLKKLEPNAGTPDDPNQTELQKRLKAIDDYYDPTLASLKEAYDKAKMQNLPTAGTIAEEYQALLSEKIAARNKVLKEFTQ